MIQMFFMWYFFPSLCVQMKKMKTTTSKSTTKAVEIVLAYIPAMVAAGSSHRSTLPVLTDSMATKILGAMKPMAESKRYKFFTLNLFLEYNEFVPLMTLTRPDMDQNSTMTPIMGSTVPDSLLMK